MKFKRICLLVFLCFLLTPFVALASLKFVIEGLATSRAMSIMDTELSNAKHTDLDSYIIELSGAYHKKYIEKNDENFWLKFFPYRFILTNSLLPDFIRLESGAVETLSISGHCDSIARALAFGLRLKGFDAAQFNMVNPHSAGHSIVQIKLNENREVVVDPYYGVYPLSEGKLISAEKARELKRYARAPQEIWKPFSENPDFSFYEAFQDVVFQDENGEVLIHSDIDLIGYDNITIGVADRKNDDLNSELSNSVLNSYWTYLGHRYDRKFVRSMVFNTPTRVTFLAIEAIDNKFLTMTNEATISGKKIVFLLGKDEKLVFVDGRAKRDWLALNSFQLLDQIVIENCLISC